MKYLKPWRSDPPKYSGDYLVFTGDEYFQCHWKRTQSTWVRNDGSGSPVSVQAWVELPLHYPGNIRQEE